MSTELAVAPNSPSLVGRAAQATDASGTPLRVLHVYRRFHPDYTGDGIYYTRLIPHLAARGIDSEVLAYETAPPDGRGTALHEGIPVHYLANLHGRGSEATLLRWLGVNLRRFDVIHLHSHVDRHFAACIMARLRGRPVLFSCSLDDSPTQLLEHYSPQNRGLVALLMRSINAFVVISPHLLRRSLESVGQERLRFIPQGVALDFAPVTAAERSAARRLLGFADDDLVLLNVGSVSRRKNVAFLVEALARIADPRVRLAVVGPLLEEDYLAEIQAQISASGLGERVRLAGFQADPGAWYTAADGFVFASTAEGFPNVYLEAMARSLPIITLFLPGLTDFIVDHGRTGFLAHDLDQFADALRQLQADPGLRLRMGEANRRFAERNLEIGAVASNYAALYRELRGTADAFVPARLPLPELGIRFANRMSEGPAAIGLEEFDVPASWPPLLQVVIDTEADFDWQKGVATDVGQVSSIVALQESFDVFRAEGVLPTLVIDHPVATQEVSRRIVRALAAEGCEVGVHLHPWTTPPIVEIKDDWHSFSGNLGPWLERAKLGTLTHRVEDLLGEPARIFKAGRYGLSPDTAEAIEELGFDIDLSICPYYDYGHLGGPDFSRFTSRPGWFGRGGRRVLSLPTTAAPVGWLRDRAGPVMWATRNRWGRRTGLGRIAGRLHAFQPLRLSPEGCRFSDMRGVAEWLHRSGIRIFTLSLHSPTLQVGNTPYVRNAEERQAMLDDIARFLRFFRETMGGSFTTPSALHARLQGEGATRP